MNIAVRLWILLSTWLVASGWILSAFHALNRAGYIICFAPVAVAAIIWRQTSGKNALLYPIHWWRKFRTRFKRLAPLLFLLIVLLNLTAGLANQPQNGDSNAYRVPRVLHWLANDGWQWIRTGDSRMNIAGNGYEWLYTPLILFTRTDRWIFLPNIISLLLLPGLIFSVFRRLRIAGRVSWWWMWILASGWCYVLQADSTLNDSLGVVYALAAVDFALRAGISGKISELSLSILAAALLTGIKQTNLPLLLPWFVAAAPVARLLLKRPTISAGIIALGLLVSAVPMAYLNWAHTGSWVGFPKEAAGQVWAWGGQQQLTSPGWGILGNLFCMSAQNLLPLFFPAASAWNNAMQHFVQTPFGSHFNQFEVFGHLGRSASEATAGIGLGAVALLIFSMLALRCVRQPPVSVERQKPSWQLRLLYFTPWLSLLVFMAKVGTYQNARQAAPYYVLLFPLFLASAKHLWLTRRRWWRMLALLVLLVTTAYIGFVRGRTLLPPAIITRLQESHPHAKLLSVIGDFYAARASVEAQRNFLKSSAAADERIVGFATTCSGAEPGWWMPLGQRQVVRVLPGDAPADLRKQGIRYVAVEDVALQAASLTIEQWTARYNGTVVDQVTFSKDPGTPPAHLYLVCLD